MGRRIPSWLLGTAALVLVVGAAPAAGATAQAQPPNDPLFRHQWNLRAIEIPRAWAISRGAGAIVAVLDTGVAYEDRGHYRRAPDLAGTRFVRGWDFVDNDRFPIDVPPQDGRRSHGTLIAALIAQTANNGIGGAGVAPAAAIMPVRVLRSDLQGSGANIARGVRFAADHGADVINLSLAGPAPRRVLGKAIDYAVAKGATIVAAAGNYGRASVGWPAAYENVLAVGALSRNLTRAPYSNYGGALDLVAPSGAGERADAGGGPSDGVIAQSLKGGPATFCFCFMASTSAAAAHVSGVAALLVGSRKARDPGDVRAALLAGARDLGRRGKDVEFGAGLVQARRALSAAGRPTEGASAARPAQNTRGSDKGSGSGGGSSTWLVLALVGVGLAALLGLLAAHRRRRGVA